MKIYLLPGLGYDCRIYERLDFKTHEVKHLNWIEPKRGEAIQEYAKRMCVDVLNDEGEIILIGHSLGGIIAQEIASITKIKKVILLSSIKSRAEMPRFFKLVAPFRLQLLFTRQISLRTIQFWGKNHGMETREDQALFKSMVGKQSNFYLQWALKSLSRWKAPSLLQETAIFQIHGTDDKTFPISLIHKPDVVIENGSHFMVFKQAERIGRILLEGIKE